MVQKLPQKDFKFANETTLEQILEAPDDGETGYFCEVDLEFPKELHDKFKQFPPCPEPDWFSDYQKEAMEKRIRKQQRRNWCRT